jgi:predicted nucleotidyltransferase
MPLPMTIESVSAEIRKIIAPHADLVKKVGIFGSLARGDFNEGSDIDLLIEYATVHDMNMNRFELFCKVCNDMIDYLINVFGRSVDLVHFEGEPTIGLYDDDFDKEVVWL